MSRKILSTSSSGLDYLDIDHDIELIRLRIHINNVEFIDGKNISHDRLNYLMTELSPSGVHTSPAPAEEVKAQLLDLHKQGYKEAFITCLSSQVSESYRIITSVAAELKGLMDIYVYDCKDLNICEAMLALEAEHLTRQGMSMADIVIRLDKLRAAHEMLFAVEDLSYLIKNKKLSAVSGFVANLLKIKPVLHATEDGKIEPINRIRHYNKSLEYVIGHCVEIAKRNNTFVYLLSVGRPELNAYAMEEFKRRTGKDKMVVLPVSSISMANHGPTGVALCYFDGAIPHAAELLEQKA